MWWLYFNFSLRFRIFYFFFLDFSICKTVQFIKYRGKVSQIFFWIFLSRFFFSRKSTRIFFADNVNVLNTSRHETPLSIAALFPRKFKSKLKDRSNPFYFIQFYRNFITKRTRALFYSILFAEILSLARSSSTKNRFRAGFAIAGEMTRPSGIEMQSRSRYVWISLKKSLAGSSSIYASRFHIGAPWSAGKLGRRHAPRHAGRWHMSAHVFPPAYIAQPCSIPRQIYGPHLCLFHERRRDNARKSLALA